MRNVFRSPLRVFCRNLSDGRKGSARLRPSLAVAAAFALLVALAPLAGLVSAQKPGLPQYPIAEDRSTYIIYQTPDGETTCRVATPAEAASMGRESGLQLRQINHLTPKDSARPEASAGLIIILRGTARLEENQQAKQAFIAAAAKWEALVSSQITVTIDVDFGPDFFGDTTKPYGANTLGATSSGGFRVDYPSVRQRLVNRAPAGSEEAALLNSLPASSLPTDIGNVPEVFVPPSIMRALGFGFNEATAPVPRIGFNSAFAFDFDPTNGVTFNQTDFDSVAVHEIGHALGFNSQVGARELNSTLPLLATVWDFYRFRPGVGTPANFSGAPRVLSSGTSNTDPHVHFSGGAEIALSTGKPDGSGGDGQQASHWKDDAPGVPNIGIMDPTIQRGRHLEITANDLKAVDFFGYSLGPPTPPPANDNFAAAQTLPTSSGRVTGTNSGATKEAGEPSHSPDNNPGGKSVWYRWQSPSTGTVVFNTHLSPLGPGSTFDTTLAVYTGSSVNALTAIAKNDDDLNLNLQTSIVSFTAVAGTTYMIAVDGWNADSGTVVLNWNHDGPSGTVQFAASAFTVGEAGHAVITVTRPGGGVFSVNYTTADGTATMTPNFVGLGSDYAGTAGTLTFAAGETTKSFNVPIREDFADETDETVLLSLSSPTAGAQLGTPSNAVLTIIDDDPPPALSIDDAVVTEGNAGTVNAVFFVRLPFENGLPVSVNYSTADGTAAAGSDYTAASGTLNFAPGDRTKTVSVAVSGDTLVEGNENFFLNLSGPVNATIPDPQGTGLIVNDDGASVNAAIQFNGPTYGFSETSRSALIHLTRAGNLGLAVSVDVRTVDNGAAVACGDTTTLPGVAFARCDYATTIETVTFGAGETSKTIAVPLIDDAHGEPSETVQLALSNPSAGALLGTQSTAVLQIGSDEPEGQTGAVNPIGGNSFFVRQHYLDFLSREPEVGEPWTGVLDRCPNVNNTDPNATSAGCDFNIVSSSFFRSEEFELKGRYAFRFYKVSFGRLPDYPEIVTDMRQLTGATGPQTVARRAAFPAAWVQRADFRAAFDGMSNTDFVNTVMNRYGPGLLLITTFHPSTPEGGAKVQLSRTGMASALNNGQWTRAQVLRAIVDSDEVGRAEFNPSFVAMQYYGYLRRAPEASGYNAWLNYLNQNPTDFRTMVDGFMNSVEYRLRFGAR